MAERRLRQKRPRSHRSNGGNNGGCLPGVHGNLPAKRVQLHTGNSEHGRGVHGESRMTDRLKFPAPYFGGKSKVAALVWQRLGDCDNFIEPFVGSGAVLLARPHPPRIETLNDLDAYIACVWRALKHDPEGVAEFADDVVSEADLHARHRFLVGVERPEPVVPERFAADPSAREAYLAGYLGEHRAYAAAFRQRMRQDPDYFDVRIAGWYLWGLSCWIGGGWCSEAKLERCKGATPALAGSDGKGQGVVRALPQSQQVPRAAGGKNGAPGVTGGPRPRDQGGSGQGDAGVGFRAGASPGDAGGPAGSPGHAEEPRRPYLGTGHADDKGGSCPGRGVHAKGPADGGRPQLADAYSRGRGVHNDNHLKQERPELGDAYSRGRGVHANDAAGTCAQRRQWLVEWFSRLRDRLRTVRVCAGSWERVCDSESVTVRLGTTGIFFDPPYLTHNDKGEASRAGGLYATDGGKDSLIAIRDNLLAYCLERGSHPRMRLAVCGYQGDGYEQLLKHGWDEVRWRAAGGYGNRSAKGKKNAGRERIWFSPNCLKVQQPGLFDALEEPENSSE